MESRDATKDQEWEKTSFMVCLFYNYALKMKRARRDVNRYSLIPDSWCIHFHPTLASPSRPHALTRSSLLLKWFLPWMVVAFYHHPNCFVLRPGQAFCLAGSQTHGGRSEELWLNWLSCNRPKGSTWKDVRWSKVRASSSGYRRKQERSSFVAGGFSRKGADGSPIRFHADNPIRTI